MKISLLIFSMLLTLIGKNKPEDVSYADVNIYPTTACVIAVNYNENDKGNAVVVTTFSDIKYVFYTNEPDEWLPGDIVALTMSDNGTEDVLDDAIIEYRYTGWVEQWAYDINLLDYKYKFLD